MISVRASGGFGPLCSALCLFLLAMPRESLSAVDAWSFKVFLDDKPIGRHEFDVERRADTVVVTTEAEFDVRILFINAFSYRHENVETWRDDCLLTIDASTDNNGQALRVAGQAVDERFDLVATNERRSLPGCIRTFAYWNPAILEADRLLNSQTGDFEDVSVEFEGKDQLRINGVPTPSNRYALTTKGGKISLWYSQDDQRWLALEAPAKGGRRLRYVPVNVPPPAAGARLARIEQDADEKALQRAWRRDSTRDVDARAQLVAPGTATITP